MTALALPLLLALVVQQDPSPPPRDPIAVLTEQVREAHGATTKDAAADRFAARVQIEPSREQEHVVVTLDVRFWRDGPRSLIRYKVDERGKKIERGRDARGFWVRIGDEVTGLGGREHETERDAVLRHVRLARQMLEFLDPGELIASLTTTTAVRDQVLQVGGREKPLPCRVVTGTAASFPLYGTAGEGQPCRVSLWIEAQTHRLAAVDVVPLDKEGKPQAGGELLRLRDHRTRPSDNRVLPTEVVIYQRQDGKLHKLAKVTLMALELAPTLNEASFDRDKPW